MKLECAKTYILYCKFPDMNREVEDGSCYGYYGSDEWEYMYSEAKGEAEACERNRAEQSAHALHSLDLFDAASYHELSMSDVAGAYEARLQEGFEAIGACTRKLKEEGYWNTGTIAIG